MGSRAIDTRVMFSRALRVGGCHSPGRTSRPRSGRSCACPRPGRWQHECDCSRKSVSMPRKRIPQVVQLPLHQIRQRNELRTGHRPEDQWTAQNARIGTVGRRWERGGLRAGGQRDRHAIGQMPAPRGGWELIGRPALHVARVVRVEGRELHHIPRNERPRVCTRCPVRPRHRHSLQHGRWDGQSCHSHSEDWLAVHPLRCRRVREHSRQNGHVHSFHRYTGCRVEEVLESWIQRHRGAPVIDVSHTLHAELTL